MAPRPQEPGTGTSSRGNDNRTPSLRDAFLSGMFACIPPQDELLDFNEQISEHPASGEEEEKPKELEKEQEKQQEEPEHDEAWETEKEAELQKTGCIALVVCVFMFVYGKVMVESSLPPDPRQNGWITMASSIPSLVLSLTYVVAVTMVGPRLMHGRQPFRGLKKFMAVYNAAQVIFSAWIFSMLGRGGWFNDSYSFQCQLCDYSENPEAVMMMHGAYWFLISKFVDYFDTIFMVANKKYNQVTPLHVVHHSLMAINMYFGVRYMPGGHSTFLCLLNSFVHIVMYFYYGLTSLGPWIRPYLWWKRHLTKLQITQFCAIIAHATQLLFIDCTVPAAVTRWTIGTTWMFLYLFVDFYIKAYTKKKGRKNEITPSDKDEHQDTGALGNKSEMTPLISEEITTITRRQSKRIATPRAA